MQSYMRIIPHNKMYTKRIVLDKGNFGVVYKIELDGEECALKVCKIEMKEDTALNRF
jgi:predicted Ser/Thr protein kinase